MATKTSTKTAVILAVLAITALSVLAGEGDLLWYNTFDNSDTEFSYGIIQADNGGYYTFGTVNFNMDYDLVVIQANPEGDFVWSETYGQSQNDGAMSMIKCSDGNYLLAGWTRSAASYNLDVWLMKIDSQGGKVWSVNYGTPEDDYALDVIETSDGGYLAVGACDNYEHSTYKGSLWMLKVNTDGDSLWSRRYNGNPWSEAYTVIETQDDGYMVAGNLAVDDWNMNAWLLKTDLSGDTLWTKVYGDEEEEMFRSIIQASDNQFVLTGTTSGSTSKVLLMKVDAQGDTVWTNSYGEDPFNAGYCVIESSNEGYLVATHGEFDLLRTDESGQLLWEKDFPDSICTAPYMIIENTGGNYVLAGQSDKSPLEDLDMSIVCLEGTATSAPPELTETPLTFQVDAPYPNPFNPVSTISFQLPVASDVEINIYDVSGRRVEVLPGALMTAGHHRIIFDGSTMPSGLYVYRFTAGEFQASGKLVLMK